MPHMPSTCRGREFSSDASRAHRGHRGPCQQAPSRAAMSDQVSAWHTSIKSATPSQPVSCLQALQATILPPSYKQKQKEPSYPGSTLLRCSQTAPTLRNSPFSASHHRMASRHHFAPLAAEAEVSARLRVCSSTASKPSTCRGGECPSDAGSAHRGHRGPCQQVPCRGAGHNECESNPRSGPARVMRSPIETLAASPARSLPRTKSSVAWSVHAQ